MKKILPSLLLLLTTFRLLSQSPGTTPYSNTTQPPNTTLSGSVRDSATGKPIPGVSVFLNSTSKGSVTRDDGTFVISGIPPGRYQLIISAICYATLSLH